MSRTRSMSLVAGGLVGAGLLIAGTSALSGEQQAAPSPGTPVEAAGFVGKTAMLDSTGYSVGRRVFAPRSHNATWHAHTAGQLVFAESGHGRLQIQGQPVRVLAPGDSAYVPPATMHWHGSAPDETFTMMFITMGSSTTSQGEPITDAVYLGRK
jgi:quercetin dioxygenase-like cupin family protein